LRTEERPPIWRVAANILNKQSRTADKEWSSSWGLVRCWQLTLKFYHVVKQSNIKFRTLTDSLWQLFILAKLKLSVFKFKFHTEGETEV
jgi:hypothetical protein